MQSHPNCKLFHQLNCPKLMPNMSPPDENTEVGETYLETAQTTSKRPCRFTAKRINYKAELENVDGEGSGGDDSEDDGVRKKRPTKKRASKGAGADVATALAKSSKATTSSTSATVPKTKTRKRKSVAASKLATKPSLSADIPVITLESSDNDQREAVLKTAAANQRPALPPPNYLKLWTSTYRPKSTEELVGQKEAVDAASGVGKTALVYALAGESVNG
ncbi:hypothetical protein TYRP_001778 [Tyrophagus putrescentiae]|nr:hypothetical protein TYRP_001778 [Tyrophagus putrescentiae]